MKKLFLILTTLLALTACGVEKYNEGETVTHGFLGTVTSTKLSDTTQTYSDTNVNFVITEGVNGTVTLTMNKTHFVERMPRLTMTVPDISTSTEVLGNRTLSCSADGIVPMAGGVEFEQYRITNLTGALSGGNLSLQFDCIGYQVTYSGGAVAE